MRVFKLTMYGGGSCYSENIKDLTAMIESEFENNEEYETDNHNILIETVEMTQEEYEALGDFDGF